MSTSTLQHAKNQKFDEFYTQLVDIEKEVHHYRKHFQGKTVFLNCDDPVKSNFWQYFALNFTHLGLKKLIATHFERERPSYKLELTTDSDGQQCICTIPLQQNGDFRSPECLAILQEADIVVTNPPFSLFREYVAQLMQYHKKFLILGNKNAITYKDCFKLIQQNKMWPGYDNNSAKWFQVPEGVEYDKVVDGVKLKSIPAYWFTNLDYTKRHENLILYRHYTPEAYPTYDNYDAINVDKVCDIPIDYDGIMGVPITFLNKYNPDQFEIIGLLADKREKSEALLQGTPFYLDEQHKKYVGGVVKGKATYARIIIKGKSS